ncbi:MAG: hypothetical protein PHO89_02065 [Methylacidiphilaceae bacterium]|nr:hypothetical protein [Candidatus Methylacidiphilaceae bacterium]
MTPTGERRQRPIPGLFLLFLVVSTLLSARPVLGASAPQLEAADTKIDLAALVRKHALSNEELLTLIKGLAAWPATVLDTLPDALGLPFQGQWPKVQEQKRWQPARLWWGAPYFTKEWGRPVDLSRRTFEETGLALGVYGAGCPVRHRPRHPRNDPPFFRAAQDDPNPEAKGAVVAIDIFMENKFVPPQVNVAFRKGRISLRNDDVVQAWGEADLEHDLFAEKYFNHKRQRISYGLEATWGLRRHENPDYGTLIFFTFYTNSAEEVPLVVDLRYPVLAEKENAEKKKEKSAQ